MVSRTWYSTLFPTFLVRKMYMSWITLLVLGSMRNGPRVPSTLTLCMASMKAFRSSVRPPVCFKASKISRAVS